MRVRPSSRSRKMSPPCQSACGHGIQQQLQQTQEQPLLRASSLPVQLLKGRCLRTLLEMEHDAPGQGRHGRSSISSSGLNKTQQRQHHGYSSSNGGGAPCPEQGQPMEQQQHYGRNSITSSSGGAARCLHTQQRPNGLRSLSGAACGVPHALPREQVQYNNGSRRGPGSGSGDGTWRRRSRSCAASLHHPTSHQQQGREEALQHQHQQRQHQQQRHNGRQPHSVAVLFPWQQGQLSRPGGCDSSNSCSWQGSMKEGSPIQHLPSIGGCAEAHYCPGGNCNSSSSWQGAGGLHMPCRTQPTLSSSSCHTASRCEGAPGLLSQAGFGSGGSSSIHGWRSDGNAGGGTAGVPRCGSGCCGAAGIDSRQGSTALCSCAGNHAVQPLGDHCGLVDFNSSRAGDFSCQAVPLQGTCSLHAGRGDGRPVAPVACPGVSPRLAEPLDDVSIAPYGSSSNDKHDHQQQYLQQQQQLHVQCGYSSNRFTMAEGTSTRSCRVHDDSISQLLGGATEADKLLAELTAGTYRSLADPSDFMAVAEDWRSSTKSPVMPER